MRVMKKVEGGAESAATSVNFHPAVVSAGLGIRLQLLQVTPESCVPQAWNLVHCSTSNSIRRIAPLSSDNRLCQIFRASWNYHLSLVGS
jgi:hypothetical protein